MRTDGGKHLTVDVPFADGNVQTRIWSAPIGRVQLYLLDSNLDENSPADRDITARLYGGDEPMRIRQEILLGVGGLRALHAVGVEPNDHHSAFCMTVPALKLSGGANGVSRLHGEVSRRMWQDLWPIFSQHEILIGRITNGVHIHTWTAPEMSDLFERHLGNTSISNKATQVRVSFAGSLDFPLQDAVLAFHQQVAAAVCQHRNTHEGYGAENDASFGH